MKFGRFLFTIVLGLAALWGVVSYGVDTAEAKVGESNVTAASARGKTKVEGQDVIVEILVGVEKGENGNAKAQAALRRVYPHVEPIDFANYETNGLVWDVFSDGDASNDEVVVRYNGNDAPSELVATDHRGAWVDAMAGWTNVESSSFVFTDGGDTGKCPSLVQECRGPQKFDGNNDVSWLNINDPQVLGVTWYGTQTDEFDMALDNKNFTWHVGDVNGIGANEYDAQTVWSHEFGHGLGLGHSGVVGAVMEPFYAGPRRDLHQDDIDGVSFLYPVEEVGPTATPTPTVDPTPTPDEPDPNPTPGCWPPGKCKNKK